MNYDLYEEQFDPMRTDRKARRKRKPKAKHKPKKSQQAIIEEIADTRGLEGGFNTTYKPSKYEFGWLLESLKIFYDMSVLTDVLAQVKGGKEASVYRCKAHDSHELDLIAAKVYRPRMFRNLRNDKMYREGRSMLKSNGKAIKRTDHRLMRAIGKKTAFGAQVAHTSWLMYEMETLKTLFDAGADVPQPIASNDNAILMGYIGDEHEAAHTLNEVTDLDFNEAKHLFEKTLHNIDLMLQHDIIHGDLSAYNILYWHGDITLIDFPQVTNPHTNTNAHMIFSRDVQRICEYFGRYGVETDAQGLIDDLWQRHIGEIPVPETYDIYDPFEE